MSRNPLLIIGTAVIVLSVLFVMTMIATDPGDNLTIVNADLIKDKLGNTYVSGSLKNNTDHPYSDIEIAIGFITNEGKSTQTTIVKHPMLHAGALWNFKIPAHIKNVSSFEIESIVTKEETIEKN